MTRKVCLFAVVVFLALYSLSALSAPVSISVQTEEGRIMSTTVEIGQTVQLVAKVRSDEDYTVKWSSKKPKIASVKDGLVMGVKAGTTKIFASVGKSKGFIQITVVDPTLPTGISLEPSQSTTMRVGETLTIKATVMPQTFVGEIKWKSSKPSIASVKNGVVTSHKKGKTVITAKTTRGNLSIKLSITVVAATSTPVPVVPQLKQDTYLIADKTFTIENDMFTLTILEDTYYHKNIEALVKEVFKKNEKSLNLKYNDGAMFNGEAWNKPKVNYINKTGGAWGFAEEARLSTMDLMIEIPSSGLPVLIHETTHMLHNRYSSVSNKVFNEMIAIMNTRRVAQQMSVPCRSIESTYHNYANDDVLKNSAKARDFFINGKDWDAYLFAYRLGLYLEETYGFDIFSRLITMGNQQTDSEGWVDVLELATSPTLFDDLVEWYIPRADVIRTHSDEASVDAKDIAVLYTAPRYNRVHLVFWDMENSSDISITNFKNIQIDYSIAFSMLQERGCLIKGLAGYFRTWGKTTAYFYDANNTLLSTVDNHPRGGTYTYFDVPGAVRATIDNDGGRVYFCLRDYFTREGSKSRATRKALARHI